MCGCGGGGGITSYAGAHNAPAASGQGNLYRVVYPDGAQRSFLTMVEAYAQAAVSGGAVSQYYADATEYLAVQEQTRVG